MGSLLARPILGEKGADSAWWLRRAFGRSLRLRFGFHFATSLALALSFRGGKGLVTLLSRESLSAQLLIVAARAGIPFGQFPWSRKWKQIFLSAPLPAPFDVAAYVCWSAPALAAAAAAFAPALAAALRLLISF